MSFIEVIGYIICAALLFTAPFIAHDTETGEPMEALITIMILAFAFKLIIAKKTFEEII